MFHLPPGNCWNPEAVRDVLRSHCVEASIAGTNIRIKLPDGKPQTIVARVLKALHFRYSKYVTLIYYPTKFIYNIQLEDFWPRTRIEPTCFDDIESAMLKLGCVVDCERNIAAQYCPDDAALARLFDEIDRLSAEIEQLISVQDFESAALRRNEEDLIRTKIDAILFSSASTQIQRQCD